MFDIRRREFITLLGGAAIAWPRNGLAQSPPKRSLIGFLAASSKAAGERFYSGFPLGMRELGYLEGRDYGVEYRYADGDASRLPLLAEELVRLKPDVIVTAATPATLAARRATASIPIVGVNLTDPVAFGLVASEARPGTNVTGILFRLEGLTAKQVEIALDLMPVASNMGILSNVTNPSNVLQRREVEAAAGSQVYSAEPFSESIRVTARDLVCAVPVAPQAEHSNRVVPPGSGGHTSIGSLHPGHARSAGRGGRWRSRARLRYAAMGSRPTAARRTSTVSGACNHAGMYWPSRMMSCVP